MDITLRRRSQLALGESWSTMLFESFHASFTYLQGLSRHNFESPKTYFV